jgi:hypothetical protein
MKGTGGLVVALVAATLVTGCTDHTPPSDKPASTVTVSDPRGDTWEVRRQRQLPSTVTRNVDLAGLTVSYDRHGMVFEVTFAQPIDLTQAEGFGILIKFEDPASESDDYTLEWSSGDPLTARPSNSVGPNDLCHPTARTRDRQGRVRIVYPAGSFCFPAERPAQVHVFRVETWRNGVQDDMFTSEPEQDRGVWVTLG